MKILLLTPYIPYPLDEGGKIAQYSVIDSLRKVCRLVLAVNIYSKYDENKVKILKQHWPDVEFRKLQTFQKDKKPSFRENIKNILRRYYQKLMFSLKEKIVSTTNHDTENSYFINLFQIKQRSFVEKLSAIISEVNPDIVQIDVLDYIDLGMLIPHHIKKVFVHHELRFVKLQFFFEGRNHKMSAYDQYIIEKIRNEELTFLKMYDGIFVFSEADKEKLVKEGISKNIYITPFSILDKHFVPVTEENTVIQKLVFVGGENHSPNIDAVEWYINEIAAAINKVKKIVFYVVGKWSETIINKYKDNPNIHFAGFIEDIISHCKQSVMLVPVRMGSGIRTKILYAMAQGVPVISTTIGCEGIPVNKNESILIADTPDEFRTAFKTILNNSDTSLNMIRSAQAIAYKYYSQENVTALRMKYFVEILSN